jgi:hypothetical protein
MATKKKTSDRPLQADEAAELVQAIENGYLLLNKSAKTSRPQDVQVAIRDEIDNIVSGKKKIKKNAKDEIVLNLGCLWGHTICQSMKWEWRVVTVDGDEFIAVAPRNRAFVLGALNFISTQLEKNPPEENTSLLLFNMLLDGKSFGKGKAGAYVTLG